MISKKIFFYKAIILPNELSLDSKNDRCNRNAFGQPQCLRFTLHDFGFGYMINDTWTVGATIPAGDNEDFRVFARYYWNESIYLTANTTTEDFSDNLRLGAGYSFAAYGSFYIEPNYTFLLQEDADGERNGKLKLGLAYRF